LGSHANKVTIAMIFPSMTLVKVIAAQIVGLLMVGGSAG
jgi:putative transport protein